MKTPQQAAQAWVDSQGRATTNYGQGVDSYSGDWAGATVAQESVALSNITQAFTSGLWRSKVLETGTAGWKSATQAKKANYGTGFGAGAAKQAAAIGKILQAEQGIVSALPPRGSHDQNVQRSVAFQNAMHALRGQLGA